jgi:solute carrier family 35, member F1/2
MSLESVRNEPEADKVLEANAKEFYGHGQAQGIPSPEEKGYIGTTTVVEAGSSTEAGNNVSNSNGDPNQPTIDDLRQEKKGWLAYMKTKDFYIVLVMGQVLALCLTATNTFTTFLVNEGTSIPAFQSLFNYILLSLIYLTYTIYRYGFRGYGRFLYKNWWKYILLSFCDVEGNYFTVLAYRYTTILSATLINFWAIVIVVLISFFFLKVRYHIAQIAGILICIGGLGILLASDHITGANQYSVDPYDQLKGDMFALVGATFYGLANVFEEFMLSERPLYEVLSQLGQWGMLINGVQAAIFDRGSFQSATWNSAVGGYLTGYTLALALFYSLGPIIFRMGSAAFFNISLLTTNFWGVIVGVQVFALSIHFMYPIAFVCIILGQIVYFLGRRVFGESFKPWLGRNQEKGVSGLFTAKRKAERPGVVV